MEIKNIGFMIGSGAPGYENILPDKEGSLAFRCEIGCKLYRVRIKGKKGTSLAECIVTGITEKEISLVSFSTITGEKTLEMTLSMAKVTLFPLPILVDLSEDEILKLSSGEGFPETLGADNFISWQRRPEYIRNIGRFSPAIGMTGDE